MRHVLVSFLSLLMACSSGGGGPTGPAESLQVSGLWIETSRLTENPCELNFPEVSTSSVTIVQNGTQLAATQQGITATGTINLSTGNFTISATISDPDLVIVVIQSGRFSSNTRYTAESRATITDGIDTCTLRSTDEGQRQ